MSSSRESSRRRASRSILGGVIGAVALVVASVMPASAVTPTPFGTNIVLNPGAEAGSASSGGNTGVSIPNWETLDNFTVVAYGSGFGFPASSEGTRIHGGNQFFAAGAQDNGNTECDDAIQFIDIKGRASAIDSGHVRITLGAQLATYDSQTDTAVVTLQFRDGNNEQVGGAGLKIHATQTGDLFVHKTATAIMPRHAREVRIILMATHHEGYCDAYFDKVSVKITSA